MNHKMIEILIISALVVLTFAYIGMCLTEKHLSEEINDLRNEFEIQKENCRYNNLMLKSKIKEFDQRLDQLEEAFDLKEYFDEEPLNEEENE